MKNRVLTYLLLLACTLAITNVSFSQKSKTQQLKAKEERLKKQLAETQELLSATKKSQNTTLSELRIINKQIAYKEELLMNMNSQIKEITFQIKQNTDQIATYNNDLERLKKEFVKMMRYAYKNRKKEHNAMYLFSSESYSQAYRRMKYIDQYTQNRKKKVIEIKELQQKLIEKNKELEKNKEFKQELIASFDEEKKKFLEVKKDQQKILNKLKSDKQSLQKKLNEQKAEQEKIAAAIRKEIEKQLAKSRKNNSFKLSPEAKLASTTFEKNKGKLPWPVSRGTITKRYGKQRHSQVSSTYIQNNGIDFSTTKGANVRAVFSGKVTSVFTIAGSGQTIIISHGGYRTVYANLKSVSVKVGQKVTTKQTIGTLLPNSSGTISEVHFEIWKISGSKPGPINPSAWLNRR